VAAAHGEAERRRVELVGNGAQAEIGLRLLVGEHEWGLGKPARGSVEAMGGRWLLPTATSTSPEGRSGRRKQLELGMCTAKGKDMQTTSLCSPGQVEQKRREEEVGVGTECGGDDVAAGRRLGTPWRAQKRAAGERSRLGEGRRRRVEGGSRRWSGGGSTAAARVGVLHRRQETEQGRQWKQGGLKGRRRRGKSEGLIWKT
jgi:hypothetical protein